MAKYRRRSTVVEAVQFDPCGEHRLTLPDGVEGVPGACADNWAYSGCTFYVTTIQGVRTPITAGEWVVTESDGVHHYPCAAAEFARLYEPADATRPDDLRAELVALLRAEVALDEWRKARNTPDSATALRKALKAAGWDGGDFNEVAWWLRDRRAAVLAKVDAAGEGRGT